MSLQGDKEEYSGAANKILPLQLDGMVWTAFNIGVVRGTVIELRDAYLKENHFQEAVILSHTVALLAHLAAHTSE